jgi:ABC-2 type transport system permease protein
MVGGLMGAYLAVARQSFRRQSTYRAAAVAGVVTNSVFGVIRASVMIAVFRQRSDINGIGVGEAITMVFFAQAMLMAVRAFGWFDISDRVRTGEIAVDLQRPLDVSGYWGSVFVGQSAFSIFARGVPPFVVGLIVFDLVVPDDLTTWIETAAVIVGAVILASRWWFLVSLGSFALSGDTRGVIQLGAMIQVLGCGAIIPLQFFSGTLGTVLRATPFAAMSQLPSEVFLGINSGPSVLAAQLAWAAVLHLIGLGGWRLCAKRLVIDGG